MLTPYLCLLDLSPSLLIVAIFRYKPAPHFVSAAPADPQYQTLNDLDNESVFGRDKVAAAIKRRNNEISGSKQRKLSSTSARK